MKTNLALVGLATKICENLSCELAKKLEMYFADVQKIIDYYLFNEEQEIKEKCGVDYLLKIKQKTINEIANYENTLIFSPYDILLNGDTARTIKKSSTIVYLEFPKAYFQDKLRETKDKIKKDELKSFLIAFDERNRVLNDFCDVCVKFKMEQINNQNEMLDKITSSIVNYFEDTKLD